MGFMRGDIMHIKRKKLRIVLIIFAVVVAMFIAVGYMMEYYTYVARNGTMVQYGEGEFASNSSYYGMIDCDGDDDKVVIRERQSGKEVSSLNVSDDWPNQIALGESSYFLLYRWESEDGDARIVQYDYKSQKMAEYISPNTAVIFCRDDYLFIGNWKKEYDEAEIEHYYYYDPFYHGFYAHYYIAESQFGNQPEPLELDSEGHCLLENESGETVELYQHGTDYFSTEPVVEDYPGTSVDSFDADDREDDYLADTQREAANRELLYKELGRGDKVCSVAEYQAGEMIYGVCNVLDKPYISIHPIEPEDVKETCFYSIDPKENQLSILYRNNSCIGLAMSEQVVVYQDGNQIIQRNLQTGKQKTIYTIKNEHNVQISVQGDYLQIEEEKKHMFQMAYDLGWTDPVLVCWND